MYYGPVCILNYKVSKCFVINCTMGPIKCKLEIMMFYFTYFNYLLNMYVCWYDVTYYIYLYTLLFYQYYLYNKVTATTK